jgi:hypothetical protein
VCSRYRSLKEGVWNPGNPSTKICIISVWCELKGGPLAVHLSAQLGGLKTHPSDLYCALIKKKIKFSSNIRKFGNGAVLKSYMRKYLTIYEEAVSHI